MKMGKEKEFHSHIVSPSPIDTLCYFVSCKRERADRPVTASFFQMEEGSGNN